MGALGGVRLAVSLSIAETRLWITREDMEKIASLVYAKSGIALRPGQKEALVVARLQKRVRAHGFSTIGEYLHYLEGEPTGGELQAMVDALTTNHTGFFRESRHFTYLAEVVVPELTGGRSLRPIAAWSAACATGEEPYSMALVLLDRVPIEQHGRIRLLASDLSTDALQTARAGVYPVERVAHLPRSLLRRYFERGVGPQAGLARVQRSVRTLVDFRQVNLMEVDSLGHQFDIVFCRNVMFYFDRAARQRVVSMLERHLAPNGWLFVSHSESLSEVQHHLRLRLPGVYQRGAA